MADWKACVLIASLTCAACGGDEPQLPGAPSPPQADPPGGASFTALVFSRTQGFRHDSIPAGVAAIRQQGSLRGFSVDATEDPGAFTDDNLTRYRTVIFLSTTGDVLNDAQQSAFERFIRRGGGFVGVHSAADTEYAWPFYGELIGAYFSSHPNIQSAAVRIENQAHPTMSSLPPIWTRTDEWYNFQRNPRGRVTVLATLDEGSYAGGTMGSDHPIVWSHTFEGGRSWYTAGGHTQDSFSEPMFVEHLGKGVLWSAGAL